MRYLASVDDRPTRLGRIGNARVPPSLINQVGHIKWGSGKYWVDAGAMVSGFMEIERIHPAEVFGRHRRGKDRRKTHLNTSFKSGL